MELAEKQSEAGTSFVTGFYHAGVTVADMERSLAFYRDGLGLEVEFDKILDGDYLKEVLALSFDTIRAVYLRIPGGGFIELLEYRGIERLSATARPCDPGGGHMCLLVSDIDQLADRLQSAGYVARSGGVSAITTGPNRGARSTYMRDPDGYSVELFEAADGPEREESR